MEWKKDERSCCNWKCCAHNNGNKNKFYSIRFFYKSTAFFLWERKRPFAWKKDHLLWNVSFAKELVCIWNDESDKDALKWVTERRKKNLQGKVNGYLCINNLWLFSLLMFEMKGRLMFFFRFSCTYVLNKIPSQMKVTVFVCFSSHKFKMEQHTKWSHGLQSHWNEHDCGRDLCCSSMHLKLSWIRESSTEFQWNENLLWNWL